MKTLITLILILQSGVTYAKSNKQDYKRGYLNGIKSTEPGYNPHFNSTPDYLVIPGTLDSGGMTYEDMELLRDPRVDRLELMRMNLELESQDAWDD